jgi:hypothetical protein
MQITKNPTDGVFCANQPIKKQRVEWLVGTHRTNAELKSQLTAHHE